MSRPGLDPLSRRRPLVLSAVLAVLLALALPAGAHARKAGSLTISGRLDEGGYTVVAIGYRGKVATTRKRAFTLRVRERAVTLQLIGPHGMYAGPVIVGGRGGRVIVGVRAGARLGTIHVLRGYARVARRVPGRWIDSRRVALARHGVPLGNGRNFGFVRSSRHNGPRDAGGDTDLDGVPNALDVAARGTLVLNALEPAGGARVSAAAADTTTPPPPPPGPAPSGPAQAQSPWMSQIFLDIAGTLNADAAGVTRAQIDATLVPRLNLKLLSVPQGDVVELDCNGLGYCSRGGTGEAITNDVFPSPGSGGPTAELEPFPSCCDSDGNGLGNLRGPGAVPLGHEQQGEVFSLAPRATSTQIGTGDLMTLLVTQNGTTTPIPAPLDFVFVTVPALQRYDDGAGDAATISYPAPDGAPGTQANPAPVAAGAGGDVVVTLTWWRPQRAGIDGAGEPDFMDIGHLLYKLDVPTPAPLQPTSGPIGGPQCSLASMSSSDPALTLQGQPDPTGVTAGQLVDGSADQPADAAHTLTATVNLSKCLRDKGTSDWPVGTTINLDIEAAAQTSSDHANQSIWFKRVS